MTIVSPSVKRTGLAQGGNAPLWEAITVKRSPAIAQSKFAAVRTALAAGGPRSRLLISNGVINLGTSGATQWVTSTMFRIKLEPALDDAGLTTFLANVDTAAT
jgi:hypothetical protein